jgi:DNA primase
VYDADSAGSKATLRGVDLVIEGGLDVRVVSLPGGEDPDSFVRKHGGTEFKKLLAGAVSFIDFKAAFFRDQGLLATPEGKTRAVRSIVETLARMKDELKRTFFLKSVAEKYDLYESVLYRELERIMGKQPGRPRPESGRVEVAQAVSEGTLQTPLTPLPPVAEQDLLRLMLLHGDEAIRFIFSHITVEHFTHPLSRAALAILLPMREQGGRGELLDHVEDPVLKGYVAGLMSSRYEISKAWAEIGSEPDEADPRKVAEDGIMRLKLEEVDRRIEEAYRRLKAAEARGEGIESYQQEVVAMQKEKIALRGKGPT